MVEVLSPSTQVYDHGQKFALYRRMPSLKEYVLIDPDTRNTEVFRRNAKGLFVLYDMSEAEALELATIDGKIAMADVFEGV